MDIYEEMTIQVLNSEPPSTRAEALWDALLHKCPYLVLDSKLADSLAYYFDYMHLSVAEMVRMQRVLLPTPSLFFFSRISQNLICSLAHEIYPNLILSTDARSPRGPDPPFPKDEAGAPL